MHLVATRAPRAGTPRYAANGKLSVSGIDKWACGERLRRVHRVAGVCPVQRRSLRMHRIHGAPGSATTTGRLRSCMKLTLTRDSRHAFPFRSGFAVTLEFAKERREPAPLSPQNNLRLAIVFISISWSSFSHYSVFSLSLSLSRVGDKWFLFRE